MSFIIYIKFKFRAHTETQVTSLISFKLTNIHYIHQPNCLQRREEGGYEYTKNKCRYVSEHGVCTHACAGLWWEQRWGCWASTKGHLPQMQEFKRNWQGVFSVMEHREAWAKGFWPRTGIAEPLEEWPSSGCVDLAEVSGGWRFCSMYSNCWHTVIAPSLWNSRKEEEGNERKKNSREGRKGGRQWVPGRLQARYLGRQKSQVRSSLWGKEERTLLSGKKAPYIQSFWILVSYLSNIGYKLFKEYLYY